MLFGINPMMMTPVGGALRPQDVFAATLYASTGGSVTVNNGVNLAGDGGLLWTKIRSGPNSTDGHRLNDSARGWANQLQSNTTDTQAAGYSITPSATGFIDGRGFEAGNNIASWSFRRAAKFFDIVTWTGNDVAGRQIAHALGAVPGKIIVKCVTNPHNWIVHHRSIGATKALFVNGANVATTYAGWWANVDPTSAHFTVGADQDVNASGKTYVAYILAHDPDPSGIVQCGSYVGNGSDTGPVITLGWRPQYLLVKAATTTGNWVMLDAARGIASGSTPYLVANLSNAESGAINVVNTSSAGFQIKTDGSFVNASGQTFIYLAIREPI